MGELHTLKPESVEAIKNKIDDATATALGSTSQESQAKIPGAVFLAINRNGDEILSHASGVRGIDSPEKMDLDTVFWLASCTKMITGIACMQLVEQGKLKLDNADLVDKLAPELRDMKILHGFDDKTGEPILVRKKNRITLRMLMSHTSGLGYTFFNPEIRRYGLPAGIDEFSGRFEDMTAPLLFEPGTKFNYGTSIDWAGILVERASSMTLNSYCQENIFGPLGVKNISFFPSPYMKTKLAYMHQRYPDGHMMSREHLQRAPIVASPLFSRDQKSHSDFEKTIFNSGGAGCFGQPKEYIKIIAMLLNDGTSPGTKKQILKKETVDEMFSNQIPEMPDFGRQPIQSANPELTNPIPELYPQPPEQEQGWGLTFMLTIHEGATGRGKNTGWWAGLPNLFWWADREKGVGGIIATQIVPFADAEVMGLWAQVEQAIYQG